MLVKWTIAGVIIGGIIGIFIGIANKNVVVGLLLGGIFGGMALYGLQKWLFVTFWK